MLTETYPSECRPDTVTISTEEYADLVRAAAQLDTIMVLAAGNSKNPLYAAIAKERNIVKTED